MPRSSVQERGRRGGDRAAIVLRSFALPEPLRAYIEALVHPAARSEGMAARHAQFIAIRLFVALVTLAALPVQFALRGAPGPLEAAMYAWLAAPLLIVSHLSRTGAFERAHLLSAFWLAALVGTIAALTGGIASFAALWIALIPLDALLSAARRTVLAALALALGLAAALWGLGALGVLPAAPAYGPAAYLFSALSAACYAGAIALGAAALVQTGEHLKLAGEARYRLLAQNMTDVITRHGPSGAVVFVSPAAERLIGANAGSLLGHGLFDRVHVADRPGYLSALADAARGRPASVEYRLRRGHDGAPESFVWVETRCHALGAGADREQRSEVVAVTRDISRHKHDASELETARAAAERANAAKSRFLATVSHELRTPLNAIIGFSEMLKNEVLLKLEPERRMDYARLIHESGQHLLAVVNGILDVSRIESGHFELRPEAIAPGPLVESCYEMMLLRAEQAGVRYRLQVAPDLPEIVADKLALRQVLINLISNAIKFTPRGGAVDVSVRLEGADLVATVADTGIGISEEDLAQVGHPFFQARSSYDRPYEGTGLGLSVVKGLVELHGGRMEIQSRLEQGTRVSVYLPRSGSVRTRVAPPEQGVIERLPLRTAPELGAADEIRVGEQEKVKRSA